VPCFPAHRKGGGKIPQQPDKVRIAAVSGETAGGRALQRPSSGLEAAVDIPAFQAKRLFRCLPVPQCPVSPQLQKGWCIIRQNLAMLFTAARGMTM